MEFHKASLKELVRVSSGEARIFPLSGLDAKPYPYMSEVLAFLKDEGIETEIVNSPFEFQRGGNMMMRLTQH